MATRGKVSKLFVNVTDEYGNFLIEDKRVTIGYELTYINSELNNSIYYDVHTNDDIKCIMKESSKNNSVYLDGGVIEIPTPILHNYKDIAAIYNYYTSLASEFGCFPQIKATHKTSKGITSGYLPSGGCDINICSKDLENIKKYKDLYDRIVIAFQNNPFLTWIFNSDNDLYVYNGEYSFTRFQDNDVILSDNRIEFKVFDMPTSSIQLEYATAFLLNFIKYVHNHKDLYNDDDDNTGHLRLRDVYIALDSNKTIQAYNIICKQIDFNHPLPKFFIERIEGRYELAKTEKDGYKKLGLEYELTKEELDVFKNDKYKLHWKNGLVDMEIVPKIVKVKKQKNTTTIKPVAEPVADITDVSITDAPIIDSSQITDIYETNDQERGQDISICL